MKKALKWVGISIGVIIAVALLTALALYVVGGSRFERTYDIEVQPIVIPDDSASIARGRHLAEAVVLCEACHGDNLGGHTILDEPLIATVNASNLTNGQGGVGNWYSDADYERAIRHGVNAQRRGLMIMHSDSFHNLSRSDLADIIAYIRSVPPVDNPIPKSSRGVLGRIFVALGMFDTGLMPLIPAEVIDHDAPFAKAPVEDTTAEYGRYLVSVAVCHSCHGTDLKGGPPIEEGAPPCPNIVVYGKPGGWPVDAFIRTIRTGVTPYGKSLDTEVMPAEVFAKMTDDELTAIWMYLASLNNNG